MRYAIGIPVLNQPETTQKCIDLLREHTKMDFFFVLVDNGSTPPLRDWLIGLKEGDQVVRNDKNIGLTKALNQIWGVAKEFGADYVVNLHTDVYIYEDNWLAKVDRVIQEAGNVGVAGFFGAFGIGTSDIYKVPYDFRQCARINPVSGKSCKTNHGQMRLSREWDKVAVLDGFSLITSIEMLEKVGGFDEKRFPIHHQYDQSLCLESINSGYQNIVIDMDCHHHGGMTDVGEDWASPFGKTKDQVHKEAHPPFYEHWSPKKKASGEHNICLPYRV